MIIAMIVITNNIDKITVPGEITNKQVLSMMSAYKDNKSEISKYKIPYLIDKLKDKQSEIESSKQSTKDKSVIPAYDQLIEDYTTKLEEALKHTSTALNVQNISADMAVDISNLESYKRRDLFMVLQDKAVLSEEDKQILASIIILAY